MARTLLITGASRGIGAATARLAAKAGYDVAVNYVANFDAAEAVVRDCIAAGVRAFAVQGDTAKIDDITRIFAETDRRFGRLDAFFNNAGIFGTSKTLAEMPRDRVERMIAVNTVGAYFCLQEAVRRMSTKRGGAGGAIVNMSSIAAKLGGNGAATDYAMSKGAIDTLTIGLAKEVADESIRVNAVRPGLIYTDIHASGGDPDRVDRLKSQVPMLRGGTADEVAEVVMFLLSDRASYITGVLVDIAGGRGL